MKPFSLGVAVALFAAMALGTAADPPAEKTVEDLARELVVVSGGDELGIQMMKHLIDSFKMSMPDVPVEFWDRALKEFDADSLTDLVVPIYVRHLSKAEMEATIAFYKTPEGQAIIAKMPIITQESMFAGEQWGRDIAAKVIDQLHVENLLDH